MTIERTMVCDNCSGIIAADNTVALVRKAAWGQCGAKRINNLDYCADCLSRRFPRAAEQKATDG